MAIVIFMYFFYSSFHMHFFFKVASTMSCSAWGIFSKTRALGEQGISFCTLVLKSNSRKNTISGIN